MAIYGRDDLIRRLARSRAPVTLLEGDSGIGKSTVLEAAQEASDGLIAPSPRTIPQSGGVLQRALLQVMGDSVAELMREMGSANQIAERLAEAARRLARDRGQGLALAVGKELLALARARLGEEVGGAIGEYVNHLRAAGDETLAARIDAAADPGVVGLVVEFCRDLGELAEGRAVILALDAGERLRDEDVRLLSEVAEHLPEAVRLRMAFSTHTESDRERVERLASDRNHISVLEVEPLAEGPIGQWLHEAGLSSDDAAAVMRATDGYGLHVGDMVGHLQGGGSIDDVPLNQRFIDRTHEAWNSLESVVKAKARQLAVFDDPLSPEETEELLGLGTPERAQLEDDLVRSRIFSSEVNGRPWFHEQRRQAIRDLLTPEERGEASTHAVHALLARAREEDTFEHVPEIARLLAQAPSVVERDGQLAAVMALDRNELAIAAALLELTDPENLGVVGSHLLSYASETFGGEDLVEALKRLRGRGLVTVVEEDGASAVVPYWRELLTRIAVMGRAANELGRLAIPAITRLVVETEVRPRLEPFTIGTYGTGRSSAATMAEPIRDMRYPPAKGVFGSDLGSNLLIRVSYGGRPISGTFLFDSRDERDQAREALDGLELDVFEERLEVTDLIDHPLHLVPDRRFVVAAERLTGKSFQVGGAKLTLDETFDLEEAFRRKAEAYRVIRDRCSEVERLAAELDVPIGLVWHGRIDPSSGQFVHTIEIRGGREGASELPDPPKIDWSDPYEAFRIEERVGLAPGEWIQHRNVRSSIAPSNNDPVLEVVELLRKRSGAFNKAQGGRFTVALEAKQLEVILTAAMQRQLADAQALAAIPVGGDHHRLAPEHTFVLVCLQKGDERYVGGHTSVAIDTRIPSPDGEERVHVRVAEFDDLRTAPGLDALAEHFGLNANDLPHTGWGEIHWALARMLGYDSERFSVVRS